MKRIVSWCLAIVLVVSCFSSLSVNTLAYAPAYAIPTLTGNKANDVANIASSQLGYTGANGTEYGAWWNGVTNWGVDYTYSGWCAMFACWCANKAGAGLYVAYNKTGHPLLCFLIGIKVAQPTIRVSRNLQLEEKLKD